MDSLTLQSHAKINLSLRILGKRADGFHEISTQLCRIALSDTVSMSRVRGRAESTLTCNDPVVPTDESNLALRALRLFEAQTGTRQSLQIHLEKRIPTGAGLGGGSSNAATVLRALNQLTGTLLSGEELWRLASQIGSDVPFFLLEESAATGTGRGENVVPLSFPWRLPLVLVKPPFPIPTPWAYHQWSDSHEMKGVLYAPQLCPWGEMVNDLERPVFEKHLLLPTLKSKLLGFSDTMAALMSGSGSTLFAVTRTAAAAEILANQAREWCGPEAFVVATHTLCTK